MQEDTRAPGEDLGQEESPRAILVLPEGDGRMRLIERLQKLVQIQKSSCVMSWKSTTDPGRKKVLQEGKSNVTPLVVKLSIGNKRILGARSLIVMGEQLLEIFWTA